LLNNNKSLVEDHLVIDVHSPDRFNAFIKTHNLPAIIYLNDEWAELNPAWVARFSKDPLFDLRYAKFMDSSNSLLKNPKIFAFINHRNSVWTTEKINMLRPELSDLDFHFIELEFSPIRLRP
jgi:hypothetical protein